MIVWHVYQLRSDTELLYVGYTRHLKVRLADHRRDKPWWPEVMSTEAEEFATEDEARQRERAVWESERPRYNKNCPFRTDEEVVRYRDRRIADMTPEERERKRQRDRDRVPRGRRDGLFINLTPEQREARRAYKRRWDAQNGRAGGWRQTGPGLF